MTGYPMAVLARQALGLLAAWLSKVSQLQCYLLGLFLFTVPFITVVQKHLISLTKRGLGEVEGFSLISHPGWK